MAYTYTTLVTALATSLVVPSSDADFNALLPTIIDDAEQLCYRELDLVASSVVDTGSAAINNRYFTLPNTQGHFLIIDQINAIDALGTRHPVAPASRETVDFLWPSDTAPSVTALPTIFARVDDTRVLFGPSAGFAATMEVIGTIRPTPLSALNSTTYLTTYLSDLFYAACMVSAAGALLKNWSAVADDPQMGQTWKAEFNTRLASCMKEELRKNYISVMSAPPAALRQ